jgi:hypothetical protein
MLFDGLFIVEQLKPQKKIVCHGKKVFWLVDNQQT